MDVPPAIQPTRLGIKHDPPQLVVEYFDGPKRRLHHVHLKVEALRYSTKHMISDLKSHPEHGPYVSNLHAQQLGELLRRLRVAVTGAEPKVPAAAAGLGRRTIGSGSRGRSSPAIPAPNRQPHSHAGAVLLGAATPSSSSSAGQPLPQSMCPGPGEGGAPPWPASAWATWSLTSCEGIGQVPDLFEDFRKSRGVAAIAASFARLLHASVAANTGIGSEAVGSPPLDAIRAAVGQQRRLARVLWERLDARRSAPDYCGRPLQKHHAVVVGAGPVGLRCALELHLLGADVVVLERRSSFDRINRLHLWPWCGEDLKGWGAKVLEPPELSFGSDPDFLHIGIGELQMLLFKACLLLGVQVFFGAEYLGSRPVDTESPEPAVWEVFSKQCDSGITEPGADRPGPAAPTQLRGISILVGADGPRGSVARAHCVELVENSGLRKEAALGIVVNFANRQSAAEKRMRSFSLARQFYESLFKDCEQQTGMALENIVCYIGPQTHYFVMTPTRKSLQHLGVLGVETAEGGALGNLDDAALGRAARAVAAFPWKPEQGPLPVETLDSPVGMPSLFDFSRTRRAASGFRVVVGPISAGRTPAKMLVGLCGDALIEPFWPEGLGIVRGFFAALDLASAARVWVETGDETEAAKHFETAYRQLKSLAAKTRQAVLRPEEQAYGLDPSTRYKFATAEGKQSRASSMPAMRIGR